MQVTSRSTKLLAAIDVAHEIGVELGPLNRPTVPRSAGRIMYADHRSTQDLRKKYAEHARQKLVDLEALVEVDLVLADRTLLEALGDRAPVDYIIASHVLEHLPDPITWLLEMAACLREGGRLSLAVPDKRFTFDHFRSCTSAREIMGWYLTQEKMPTPGQIFDHLAHAAQVDPAAVWRGASPSRVLLEGHGPAVALELARAVAAAPSYHDVHCTVFTPYSFCGVLRELLELDVLPYSVSVFEPTARGEMEFFVTLVKRTQATVPERAATVPDLDQESHHERAATSRGAGRSAGPSKLAALYRRIAVTGKRHVLGNRGR